MKFSVLMSVYHKEKADFLHAALSGIFENQTRKTDEFVLVCDGPLNEGLDSVISEFENAYPGVFKTYRLEKNEGLGNALNFGLSKCSFELVARADSDDICAPERFQTQVEFMEANPDVAVLGSDIDEFDSDPLSPHSYKKMPADNEAIYKMCKIRNPLNHMTVLFRKDVIEAVGSYRHLPYLEDYFLWIRVLANGYKIANINLPLVHARTGGGMLARRGNRQYISGWKVLNRYMRSHNMISPVEYIRNMILVRAFIYMQTDAKRFLYKTVLRRNIKSGASTRDEA